MTPRWREVEFTGFATLESSNRTTQLAADKWPEWARGDEKFQGFWVSPYDKLLSMPSTGTTAPIRGHADLERFDAKDEKPLNYDRYYYLRTADGRIYQSGPYKCLDYEHHLPSRPDELPDFE